MGIADQLDIGKLLQERLRGAAEENTKCWESKNLEMLEGVFTRLKAKRDKPLPPGTPVIVDHCVGVVVGPAEFPFTPESTSEYTGRPNMGVKHNVEILFATPHGLDTRLVPSVLLYEADITEALERREEAHEPVDVEAVHKELEHLKAVSANLSTKEDFKPGDVVTWKEELRDRKMTGKFVFFRKITPVACEKEDGPPDGSYVDCQIICENHESPTLYQVEARRLRKV